jgi:hypothetical protein
MSENKTDPAIHARMVTVKDDAPEDPAEAFEKYGVYEKDGKWVSPLGCQNSLVSTDVKEIVSFFKEMCMTMGFFIGFAINPEKKEVAHIVRKGRLCQRDVKRLLSDGYSEWSYSWAWAPKTFKFPEGDIVTVSVEYDLSPAATTREAIRWGRAIGAC